MMTRRHAVVAIVVGGLLVLGGVLAWDLRTPLEPAGQPTPSATAAAIPPPPLASHKKGSPTPLREVSIWETNAQQKAITPARPRPAPVAPPQVQPDNSSVTARQAMTRLTQIVFTSQSLTKEQAGEINGLLSQFVGEGAAAVPVIREFLKQNLDYDFNSVQGGDQVNYGTLRLGLMDALQQIGGPEVLDLSAATLQSTSDPSEIALLSRYLEQQAPGRYRQIELTAALEVLTQAATSQSAYGDLSSLFELLQAYGDPSIVPNLAKAAGRWNYYATLALAGLPNGAGIPTLIKLAQDPAISSMSSGDIALRPLAQVAVQYPDAAQALVDFARQNQIPDKAWTPVSAALAGNYIQYGNQVFGSTSLPPDWSAAQVNQRIALVNQLLSVTMSPVGRQALQNALTSLSTRLPN